ncbi:MAG: sulfatase-like hydrolase/transferase [Polyangiaceae bacterium]|nr:sulfatase-like hydrolase/transferase [Polyangiaceae bacterium]
MSDDVEATDDAARVVVGTSNARRNALRRRRRLVGFVVLLGPFLWVLATDFFRRSGHILRFDRLHAYGYAAGLGESLLFWMILLYAASRRRGFASDVAGVLFVALFTLSVGVQGAFHRMWNTYLSLDAQIYSRFVLEAMFGAVPLGQPYVLAEIALAFVVAVTLLLLARAFVRPRRIPRRIVPVFVVPALAAVAMVPVSYRVWQSTPPDMIYFHGIAGMIKENANFTNAAPDLRVRRRTPEPVPPLTAKPARRRNVLLILQESQRADVTCVAYDPDCAEATPFSNKAVPNRMPLLEMHSLDSTTAVSLSNILSGLLPTEPRELLHNAPLMWEYAKAAGWDTAYWTSQNLMFGNSRLYMQDIPARHFAIGTHLDSMADLDAGAYDRLVTDRVIRDWDKLEEPFFAVVHYSNVHFPHVYDPEHAPFQPASFDLKPNNNAQWLNYYKDVVYLSDMAVGRLLEHVRATETGQRTVIVYTSDHGEGFRDHGQLGHTTSLYEEEIRVPTWIDAPKDTLSPEEEANIRSAENEYVYHIDLGTTLLDLMGVWDDPAMVPFRRRMVGHPLTRPERTLQAVPLANCTGVWDGQFRNWGMMQGPLKVVAREWDGEFHCFDLRYDPEETNDLGEPACGALPLLARSLFHVMPNVKPPQNPKFNWGD